VWTICQLKKIKHLDYNLKLKEKIMAGYAIFNINITNPEAYKEYVSKIVDLIKKFDGEYLVKGGEYKVMEGE
jgi:hypothetical protein